MEGEIVAVAEVTAVANESTRAEICKQVHLAFATGDCSMVAKRKKVEDYDGVLGR